MRYILIFCVSLLLVSCYTPVKEVTKDDVPTSVTEMPKDTVLLVIHQVKDLEPDMYIMDKNNQPLYKSNNYEDTVPIWFIVLMCAIVAFFVGVMVSNI